MAANAEQMRIASLMNDKGDNLDDLETKVNRVIEITKSNRDKAIVALHDCDHDVDRAVELILDGDIDDTWLKPKKKADKKSHTSGTAAAGKAGANAKGGAVTSDKINGQDAHGKERGQRGPRDSGQRGGDKLQSRQSKSAPQKDNQSNRPPKGERREPRQQGDQTNSSKPLQEKNQPLNDQFQIDTFKTDNERQRSQQQGDNRGRPRPGGPRGPPRSDRPLGRREQGEKRGEGNRGPRTFSNRLHSNKNQNDNADSFPSTIDTWQSNEPNSLKVQSDMNTMTFGTWPDPSHAEEWDEDDFKTQKLETKEFTPSSRAMTNTTVSDVVRNSNQQPGQSTTHGASTGAQPTSMDFSSILKQGPVKIPQPSQQAAQQAQAPSSQPQPPQPQPQSQQGLSSLLGSTGVSRTAATTPNQAGAALLQQLQQGSNQVSAASAHAANVAGGTFSMSPHQKTASDTLKNLVGIHGGYLNQSSNVDSDPMRLGQQSAVAAVKAVAANTGSSHHRAPVRTNASRSKIPETPVEMPQHDSIGHLGVGIGNLQFGDTPLEFHNQTGSVNLGGPNTYSKSQDKTSQKLDMSSSSAGKQGLGSSRLMSSSQDSNSYVRGPSGQSVDSAIKTNISGTDLGVSNSVLGAGPSLNADMTIERSKPSMNTYPSKVGSGLNDHSSKLSYPGSVSARSANTASDISSSYGPSASSHQDSGLMGSSSVGGTGYSAPSVPSNSYMSNYGQTYPSVSYGASAASSQKFSGASFKDLESSTTVSSSAQQKSHYDPTNVSSLTGGSLGSTSSTNTTAVLSNKSLPATGKPGSGVPNVPPGVAPNVVTGLEGLYAHHMPPTQPGLPYPFPLGYNINPAFANAYNMPNPSQGRDQYYQQDAGKFSRVSEPEQNPSSVAGTQTPQSVAASQAQHYPAAFPPGYHPPYFLPHQMMPAPAQNLYQVHHGAASYIPQMTPQSQTGSSSTGYGPKGNSGYGSHYNSGYDSFSSGAGMQAQDYGSNAKSYGSSAGQQGPKGLSSGASDLGGNSSTGIYGKSHAQQLKGLQSSGQQSFNIQSGGTGFGSPYNATNHYTSMMHQAQSSAMMHQLHSAGGADVGSNQRGGGMSGHKGSSSSSNVSGKTFYQSPNTGSSTWGSN